MSVVLTVSGHRSRSVAIAAVILAAVVFVVPGAGFTYFGGWTLPPLYDWAMLVLIACAGLGLLLGDAGVGLTAVAGAALAGTGVVATRRWYTSGGFGAGPALNLGLLQVLAALLAIAGFVLVASGARTVRRIRQRTMVSVVVCASAAVTVFAVPPLFGPDSYSTATQLGSYALMYSLPWALAIVLVGWADLRTALGGLVVAAVHIVCLALDRWPMIPMRHRIPGLAVAVASLAVAALARSFAGRAGRAGAADQPAVTVIDDGSTVTGLTK